MVTGLAKLANVGSRGRRHPAGSTVPLQVPSPIRRVPGFSPQAFSVSVSPSCKKVRCSPLGRVTSGTLGPTVHEPIAMAYLAVNHAGLQHEVYAEVRGKRLPMRISPMPFTPHRYHR